MSASDRFLKAWDFPPPGPYSPSGELKSQVGIVSELRFHTTRKWKFDYAFPKVKVAIEINGGTFKRGRHSRGLGQARDMEKLNEAQRLGWIVLQFGTEKLASHRKTREVIRYVCQILEERLASVDHKPSNPKASEIRQLKNAIFNFATKGIVKIPNHRPKPPKPVRRSRP